jgi:hypothetical protein
MTGRADGSRAGEPGDVHIERLALRVAGLDEDAAVALARLVAEGLAPGLAGYGGLAGAGGLHVEVTAPGQGGPDILARRIVDEIGRVLARDRVAGGPDGEAVP